MFPRIDSKLRRYLLERDVYYGWVVVVVCFVSATVAYSIISSFGVFFSYLLAEFNASYSNTSIVFSVQVVTTFSSGALLGLFIDRYGVRRFLLLGACLVLVGLVGASQASSLIGVVLAYGLVGALGFGILFVITFATPPRWFERRRGLATALATAGVGTGILVGPPISNALIAHLGWNDAYLTMSGLAFAVLLSVAPFIADDPREVGADLSSEFADYEEPVDRDWSEQVRDVLQTVASKSFAMVFLGYLFVTGQVYILLAYLVEYSTAIGWGREVGVLAVSAIGAANVMGKFLVGPVDERTGTVWAFVLFMALMGTAMIVLPFVPSPSLGLVLVALFGVGYGATGALLSPIVANTFGTLDINALFGVSSVSFAIAGSVPPYVTGVVYDTAGTFEPSFVAGGILGILGGVFVVIASRSNR